MRRIAGFAGLFYETGDFSGSVQQRLTVEPVQCLISVFHSELPAYVGCNFPSHPGTRNFACLVLEQA